MGHGVIAAVAVGMLFAGSIAMAAVLWYYLVLPEVFLSLFERADVFDDLGERAVAPLRVALGMVLFVFAFVTGFALTFLTSTT